MIKKKEKESGVVRLAHHTSNFYFRPYITFHTVPFFLLLRRGVGLDRMEGRGGVYIQQPH